VAQLTRALAQIAALPPTPALRREQIKLQVALTTPFMHVKGYAAPETKAAAEKTRLLIEQAEAIGEPPEDPPLLVSVRGGKFQSASSSATKPWTPWATRAQRARSASTIATT
jgi:hypothetical protein